MVAHRKAAAPEWSDADLAALRPMMAESRAAPFESVDHLFEFKWDGVRYLACRVHRQFRLINRKGRDGTARYPELQDLKRLPPGTVLDGEVISLVRGVPSFSRLLKRDLLENPSRIGALSRSEPVVFVAFDVLYAEGRNMMHKSLLQRKRCVRDLVMGLNSQRVIESPHVIRHGKAMFNEAVRLGLEGVIAKRIDSRYQPGRRTSDWLKIKPALTGQFQIIGLMPDDKRGRISALLLGEQVHGRLAYRGKVGSGFSESSRRELYKQLTELPQRRDPPPGGPAHAQWKTTNMRCVVRYFERTEDGKLRAPVFRGIV